VCSLGMAGDDLDGSKNAGGGLLAAVKKVNMNEFSGQARDRWMELSKQLSNSAGSISKAKDIDAARDAFFYLSNATIDLHRAFGHVGSRTYYLDFCPMARDGGGAYWLQHSEELLNPYYGASMLHCGTVEETFTAVSGEKR